MKARGLQVWGAIGLALVLFGLAGCNPSGSDQQGIHVLFESNPRLYQPDVYYFGQVVGQVIDQKQGAGTAYRVTVRLKPEYGKEASTNWVFYADNGSLNVARLSGPGRPLNPGDNICGFGSKAALNWFKLKTLLTDRIYKATQKAKSLSRQFS